MNVTKIILKKDLGYSFEKEEEQLLNSMSDEEVSMVRDNLLKNIREKILPLDVLEENLELLKKDEYIKFLNGDGAHLSIEKQIEYEVFLESKCNRMIINLAKNNCSRYDLLGPNIRDTYGINARKQ